MLTVMVKMDGTMAGMLVTTVTPIQICCLADNVYQGTQTGESDNNGDCLPRNVMVTVSMMKATAMAADTGMVSVKTVSTAYTMAMAMTIKTQT
eukprot:6212529-Ditylum_brightwellii.AAC.1